MGKYSCESVPSECSVVNFTGLRTKATLESTSLQFSLQSLIFSVPSFVFFAYLVFPVRPSVCLHSPFQPLGCPPAAAGNNFYSRSVVLDCRKLRRSANPESRVHHH